MLTELLMLECEERERRRAEARLRTAGFPRQKWPADFDYTANPAISPAVINTLTKCEWARNGLPLCLIGDSAPGNRTFS